MDFWLPLLYFALDLHIIYQCLISADLSIKSSIKIKLFPHNPHIILKIYPTGNKRLLWQRIFAQKSSKWISFENQKKPHLRVLGKCLSLENRYLQDSQTDAKFYCEFLSF